MRRIFYKLLAALAITLLGVSSVQAVPVRWAFEGVFTTSSSEFVQAGLSVGDKMFGEILFLSDAIDQQQSDGMVGIYEGVSGLLSVPTLGAYRSFVGSDTLRNIVIQDNIPNSPNSPKDQFFFGLTDLLGPYFQFSAGARAFTDQLFDGDDLPLTPPLISEFEFFNFGYTDHAISADNSATGVITKLARVPEPASLTLLCLGLAGIGYQRRKQAKAA